MIKVGITGGIGSGKTHISKAFALLEVPVYFADEAGKWLLANDEEVCKAIVGSFGTEVLGDDRRIDRTKLGSLVFGQKEKLQKLEAILHPAVANHYKDWLAANRQHPYTLKEAAILFESGTYKNCDFVILVSAPEEVRLSRAMTRDSASRDKILARMGHQWTEDKKRALADFIIENDGGRLVLPQVLEVHQALLERAKSEL